MPGLFFVVGQALRGFPSRIKAWRESLTLLCKYYEYYCHPNLIFKHFVISVIFAHGPRSSDAKLQIASLKEFFHLVKAFVTLGKQ